MVGEDATRTRRPNTTERHRCRYCRGRAIDRGKEPVH